VEISCPGYRGPPYLLHSRFDFGRRSLARKRKKSKAKKKATKGAPSEEVVSVEAAEDAAQPVDLDDEAVVVIDLDDTEEGVADLLAEALALVDSPESPGDGDAHSAEAADEVVVIEDLDAALDEEEVDDAESRERLIAEALAFVENEDAVASGIEPSGFSTEDEAIEDEASEDGTREPEASAIAAPAERQAGAPERPAMSPAAIAALEAIQRGIIAGDLDDDVLDLGEVSDPDERDRLLASTMAHADMQEARYRVTTDTGSAGRGKGTIASLIFVFAMVALARPPGLLVPDPPATLSAEDALYGVHVTLLLQAQQIEAYRTRQDGLPASLADIEGQLPGVRYIRSSSRLYQLVAYSADGEAIVYDSADPDPEFAAAGRVWVVTRNDS
jgi:hypothetical protein